MAVGSEGNSRHYSLDAFRLWSRHTRIVRSWAFMLFLTSLVVFCGARAISASVEKASPRPRTGLSYRAVVRVLRHSRGVPILEYHVVGFRPQGSPLEGLYVVPSLFVRQVHWLAQHGWHGVTLRAVIAYWREGKALPPKPIVFSFDDGYPGDWRYALPVLRAHHWPGDLNLQIGNLVPTRVRQLIAAGWEIDSHTFTHPDLTRSGPARLEHEVLDSRFWIQRVFRVPAMSSATHSAGTTPRPSLRCAGPATSPQKQRTQVWQTRLRAYSLSTAYEWGRQRLRANSNRSFIDRGPTARPNEPVEEPRGSPDQPAGKAQLSPVSSCSRHSPLLLAYT